jgi:biopolymer transport protein ExbD
MRVRRLRKQSAHLEVTAFINVIVVLVPFLLSTAVFTRLSVLELTLPAPSSSVEQLKVDDLKLEIVIRPDGLEVGDRIGGLIQRIDSTATGYDLATLSLLMQQLKLKFPDKTTATVLAQPDTPYEQLVQIMDTVRETPPAPHAKGDKPAVAAALFPDISIGDAPVKLARK